MSLDRAEALDDPTRVFIGAPVARVRGPVSWSFPMAPQDSKLPSIGGETIAFLHRCDAVAGDVELALTDRGRLRAASFLDGREPFWQERSVVPLDLSYRPVSPARLAVFHVGFCGSTLLARLLDRPGRVLVLKEPQCLADIAAQRTQIERGNAIAPLPVLLDHALAHLGGAGEPDITVVLKPTNWVNSLIPALCVPGRIDHAVFVSMDPRAYLGAVFRGGRERIGFCARLAAEIAPVLPWGNEALAEAAGGGGDALDRAACIVALLHLMQETIFDGAIKANGWSAKSRIDFAHLTQHPAGVLRRVRTQLGLPQPMDDEVSVATQLERHAKDPASPFRPDRRLDEDAEVERHHAGRFDRALEWLESRWPPVN